MATQLLIATFSSRDEMLHAFDAVTMKYSNHINHAAVISRPSENEVVIMDDDLSPDEGAIAGSAMGAAMMGLGVLQMGAWILPGVGPFLAVGAGALAGALVGNLTGRFAATLIDFGFDNEQIEAVAKRLETGQPALVVEFDDSTDMTSVRQEIAPFGAEIIDPGSNRTVADVLPERNKDVAVDGEISVPGADVPVIDPETGSPVLPDVPVIPVGATLPLTAVPPMAPVMPVTPAVSPDLADDEEREHNRDMNIPPMNPVIP